MKPLFAQYLRKDSLRNSNGEETAYVEFNIKFENGTFKKYQIQTDIDFQEATSSTYEATETLSVSSENTNWLLVLFTAWKESRQEKSDLNEIKKDLFYFTSNDEGVYCCKVSECIPTTFFPEINDIEGPELSKSSLHDFFACNSSFFKPNDEPPFYEFGNRLESTLTGEQIDKIENQIHELEKEINSFWYPRKEVKASKVAALKELLEMSTKMDAHKAISTTLNHHEATAGMFSTRTFDLLSELQKEAWSKQFGNIASTCL